MFLLLFFSVSHDSLSISFIAVVAYALRISTHFSSLSFDLDVFVFFLLLKFVSSSPSLLFFHPNKIKNFCGRLFEDEIMSLFF